LAFVCTEVLEGSGCTAGNVTNQMNKDYIGNHPGKDKGFYVK